MLSNEELVKKLQLCISEYKKLEKENEELKALLEEEQQNSDYLYSCVKETTRVINESKESLTQANDTINKSKELIDYYEKCVIAMFDSISYKVENIIDNSEFKEEEIKQIQEDISNTKEELKNLNKIIL